MILGLVGVEPKNKLLFIQQMPSEFVIDYSGLTDSANDNRNITATNQGKEERGATIPKMTITQRTRHAQLYWDRK